MTGGGAPVPDHLCGSPLDPLQQLSVFLLLEAPHLDAVFQMGPHKSRVEGDNHLPVPASHPSSDGAQDTICFPTCKGTLLAHVSSIKTPRSFSAALLSRTAPSSL